jgi:hypothetical protein
VPEGVLEALKELPSPPAWAMWVAIVGVLVDVIRLIYELVHERKEKDSSVHDQFWFRTIISPRCVNPLIEFVELHAKALGTLVSNLMTTSDPQVQLTRLRQFVATYQVASNELLERLILLTVFDNEVYLQVRNCLEQLEDDLTQRLASLLIARAGEAPHELLPELRSKCWSAAVEALKVIEKRHREVA